MKKNVQLFLHNPPHPDPLPPTSWGEREKRAELSSPSPPPAEQVAGEGRGEGVVTQKRSLQLRKNPTEAEKLFWQKIRNRQVAGCKFKRQLRIDHYIVDFACCDHKLIVEIDGGQHNENELDKVRDTYLSNQGFKVVRFWNNEVLGNIEGVLDTLAAELGKRDGDKNA